MEKWKRIRDHLGYEISNLGNIKYKGELIERSYIYNTKGNIAVVYFKGKRATIYRLVAEAFLPNPNNYKFVCCKDGDKSNTNVNNLYWNNISSQARKKFPSDVKFDLNNLEKTKVRDLFLPAFLKEKLISNRVKTIEDLKEMYDNLELQNAGKITKIHFDRILDYFSKVYDIDYNKNQEWKLFSTLSAKSFKISERKDIKYGINFNSIHELFNLYALNAIDEVIHIGSNLTMVKYNNEDKYTSLKDEFDSHRYKKCYIKRNKKLRRTVFSFNNNDPNEERFRKECIIQICKNRRSSIHTEGLYDESTDTLFNRYLLNKLIIKNEAKIKSKKNLRHHLIREVR